MRVIKQRRLTSAKVTQRWRGYNNDLKLGLLYIVMMACVPMYVGAAALISQGYSAESTLPTGSIVSLKDNSTSDVRASNSDSISSILGVVINDSGSQLSISSGKGTQLQVATSGVEQVFVSNFNGDLVSGDQITASPISGVGMKVTTSSKVLGVAQDKFPNSTSTDQSYEDKSKQKHSVKLGQIPVLINVAYFYKQPDKTIVPAALQNIANALAGKKVNALPIIVSVAIFIVTLIVVVSIVYSLIHSSIISVGRNPMSQAAVYRNVLQLSLLVVVILVVSVVSIYMVLRKL